MKSFRIIIIGLIVLTTILSGFVRNTATNIKGTVSPADAGTKVTAYSKTDTLSSVVSNGMFVLSDLRPGLYNLIVEAKAPYKNGGKSEISVVAGEETDVGEIKLEK